MSCNSCGDCSNCIRPVNLFTQSMICGVIGQEPITHEVLHLLGNAVGAWMMEEYGAEALVLITHDAKSSSPWLRACLETGLLRHPVYIINENVTATGIAAHIAQRYVDDGKMISCNIMIGADHVSPMVNGFTIIDGETGLTIDEDAQRTITNNYFAMHDAYEAAQEPTIVKEQMPDESELHAQAPHGAHWFIPDISKVYIEDIIAEFTPTAFKTRKIVLDCGEGALSHVAPYIFDVFGANVIVINKESIQHPDRLAKAVEEHEADIGFAFNGEGTRLVAAASNGDVKDGDDILAILMRYTPEKIFVTTEMANQGLDAFAAKRGIELRRVAEDPIALGIAISDIDVENIDTDGGFFIGATHAGHVIMSGFHYLPDALLASLRICTVLHKTKNWAFKTFEKYPRVTATIPIEFPWPLEDAPIADVIMAARRRFSAGRIFAWYDILEPKLHVTSEHEQQGLAQNAAVELATQLAAEFAKKKIQQQVSGLKVEPEAYS